MVEDSTPGTADEEQPDADAGEGEPEDVADATAERGSDAEDAPDATVEVDANAEESARDAGETARGSGPDASAPEAAADATAESADEEPSAAPPEMGENDGSAGGESRGGPANGGFAGDESPESGNEGDGPANDAPGPDLSADDAPDDVPEDVSESATADSEAGQTVPEDVRKYERFKKMDGAEYERVNEFLRERTYVTAREWAIARLCADFRTETGVEMTKIGRNLPRLVPFMTDTYTPQAVNQARSSFEEKVNKAGATFLYGAMSGFFTAEELDEMMYEVTEIAKFLLEVEGVDLSVEEELAAEDKISEVMREVRQSSAKVRGEEVECPECGHVHDA